MRKWYYWFGFTLIWLLAALLNFYDGKNITINIIQAVLFFALGVCQFFCDKHGSKGRKILNGIYTGIFILIVAMILVAIGLAV